MLDEARKYQADVWEMLSQHPDAKFGTIHSVNDVEGTWNYGTVNVRFDGEGGTNAVQRNVVVAGLGSAIGLPEGLPRDSRL